MILKKEIKIQIAWKKVLKYFLLAITSILLLLFILNFDFLKINLLKQKMVFSPAGNFFNEEINLSITPPIKNAKIYYSIDGSTPDQNSLEYQEPITVDQARTFKFALYKNAKQLGKIQTHDVFINTKHQLAVISLSTDPVNLWDKDLGIYTEENFANKGQEWEIPGFLNFYEEDGHLGFSREVGIRIHGGGTRGLPQKSLRILIKNEQGNETLNYPLFPENKTQSFNSFILRNAGGDWSAAFLRDSLMHEIIEDANLSIDLQDYRPAVLYLNGQYWGLYDIRERYDQDYFANNYKADPKRVSIYSIPHDTGVNRGLIELDEGKDNGGTKLYEQLFDDTKRCLGCASLDYLKQYLDLANYRDYLIAQFHYNNYDWPYGNAKLWRYETNAFEPNAPYGLDGRFRWLMFDLDVGFGAGKNNEEEVQKAAQANPYQDRLIDDRFPFRNLIYDHSFANDFLNKYADLLNTVFKYENMAKKIDQLASAIDAEMPREIAKWHNKETWKGIIDDQETLVKIKVIPSYEDWQKQINLLKTMAYWRPQYMKEYTLKFFKLSGLSNITVTTNDPNKGSIKINSIVINGTEMPWTGEYFNDTKITIEAIPDRAYSFVAWEGDLDSKEQKIQVSLESDINLKAIFK